VNRVIKVLHTEWSDGWGGQEIRIIDEMLAVRDQGVEVFLACREHASIRQKAEEQKIPVFVLPFRGNLDFKTLFALKKLISQHQIDIINTHSGKDTWVGGLAAKLAGAKFIRTRHLSNRISSNPTNFINELADYIFTTGESVRSDMIKLNRIRPNRIESVPTGIDTRIYDPSLYSRIECRKKFNIQKDEIAIGIIAVLRQFKRHDLFIKMSRRIVELYPTKKFVFFIAGDGPQKGKLISLTKKLGMFSKIKFLDYISEVPELLTAIDIFVLSSDSKEGVPQSVIQALMMNKAVVATNSGSTIDLLKDNNFKLVDPNSLSSLVDGVVEYIKFPQNINTRKYIVDNFSQEKMSKKILNIYKELVV